MQHQLKAWPAFFQAIDEGRKTFEVRKNDRGFQVGDTLILQEYDPDIRGALPDGYTGNALEVEVTYVMGADQWGAINPGFVVLGVKKTGTSNAD